MVSLNQRSHLARAACGPCSSHISPVTGMSRRCGAHPDMTVVSPQRTLRTLCVLSFCWNDAQAEVRDPASPVWSAQHVFPLLCQGRELCSLPRLAFPPPVACLWLCDRSLALKQVCLHVCIYVLYLADYTDSFSFLIWLN